MRVLLLGAGGMLASDLVGLAPEQIELTARAETELDITNEWALRTALADRRPDVIINAAAYTNVDRAETDPERAFAINGHAVGLIGAAAREVDATVVHYSTDYVFDGTVAEAYTECHAPSPLGVYGASKLLGEEQLARSGARYLLVRTQWLFGLQGRSFPRIMWERAVSELPTRVVNDQTGKPTYTVDLARATWMTLCSAKSIRAVDRPAQSVGKPEPNGTILHVANRGKATWYDLARRIFEHGGHGELISSCNTAEYPTPAQRPACSVLDTSRYERISGNILPEWEDAIDRFLATMSA